MGGGTGGAEKGSSEEEGKAEEGEASAEREMKSSVLGSLQFAVCRQQFRAHT